MALLKHRCEDQTEQRFNSLPSSIRRKTRQENRGDLALGDLAFNVPAQSRSEERDRLVGALRVSIRTDRETKVTAS